MDHHQLPYNPWRIERNFYMKPSASEKNEEKRCGLKDLE